MPQRINVGTPKKNEFIDHITSAWSINKGTGTNKPSHTELKIVDEDHTVSNYLNKYFFKIPKQLATCTHNEFSNMIEIKKNDASSFYQPVDEHEYWK